MDSALEPRGSTASRNFGIAIVVVFVLVLIVVATRGGGEAWTSSVPKPESVEAKSGGTVRVAVTSPPELSDSGPGGETLRSLVLPKLFVAQPDGTWRASLVEPGTDEATDDGLTASFKLREGAKWSNGAPIGVEDLRRSADSEWVRSINDPDDEGRIVVNLQNKLPNWRRLWSGSDSVTAPSAGVYGGPYVIANIVSGLQTDLVRNENWYGAEGGPFLDGISLVVAADETLGRQLLATNQVDVFSPQAVSARTERLRAIEGVSVSTNPRSGSWVALRFSNRLSKETRLQLASKFPRALFVNGLLHDEAVLLDSFAGGDTWKQGALRTDSTVAANFAFQISTNPMLGDLQRTMQNAAGDSSTVTVTQGDNEATDNAIREGEFDVAAQFRQDGPALCWTCAFGTVDQELALRADGGDADAQRDMEEMLRNEGYALPLWHPFAIVASRSALVSGVTANGFDDSVAWNAVRWHMPQPPQ